MIHIAIIEDLDFHANENDMTKAYWEKGTNLSKEVKKLEGFSRFGNFELCVGETFDHTAEIVRNQVREFLQRRGMKPSDFSYNFKYGEARHGMTWLPTRFSNRVRLLEKDNESLID